MLSLSRLSDNTSRFIDANQQAFEWIATAADGDARDRLREKALQKWEHGNWQLTRGVELMWRGERSEHVVTEGADRNSKHVLRAILRAFEAFSSPSQPGPVSDPAAQRKTVTASRYGKKLQQVLGFTGCTEEVALECLDATDGDVQQASILALDAVSKLGM